MADDENAAAETPTLKAAEAAFEEAIEAAHPAQPGKDYRGIIDAWIAETLRNSPIAASTEAWNFLYTTAAPDLVKRLNA